MANNQSSNAFKASNTEAFNTMFKDTKMPKVDFDSALKAHKKNLETFTKAQKSYIDCAKNINTAHTDFVKQSFEDMKSHMQDLMSSKSLEEKVQAHTQRVKDFFENTMNYSRTIGEFVLKSQQDISSTVQERFTDSVNDAKEMVKRSA